MEKISNNDLENAAGGEIKTSTIKFSQECCDSKNLCPKCKRYTLANGPGVSWCDCCGYDSNERK